MMRSLYKLLVIPVALVVAACGKESAPIDAALNSDLALASSAQPYQPQQFVSPMEMQYGQMGYQPMPYQPNQGYYPQPAPVYRAPAPAPRTRVVYRTASTGRATVRREPRRHTKRDAVIGATAGAVIGATTSRDRVKGAIIGAAAGGVLGAIIGHTVDVDR